MQLDERIPGNTRLFRAFLRSEALGGGLLLACTVAALAWANSPWAESYFGLLQAKLGLRWGERLLALSVQHWINDGLMAVFFFSVGLEIKRELLTGHLSSRRKALLPAAAALGAMILPAGIYAALNWGQPGAGGWGIPMATDIAFSLGVLAVLGRRVPVGLKVLLAAAAIADDLGAVLVIALFYAGPLCWPALAAAAALLVVTAVVLRSEKLRRAVILVPLAVAVWAAVYLSGVHATIAGVLLAAMVPCRGRATDPHQPLGVRLEHILQPVQALAILPLFALANAGVAVEAASLRAGLSPVGLGVFLGLFVGKPLGFLLAAAAAVRFGAVLPHGVNWRQFAGVGWLAGIGFTMSLFIAELGLTDPELHAGGKLAILAASAAAALAGLAVLASSSRGRDNGGLPQQ